jgi:serine protease Do
MIVLLKAIGVSDLQVPELAPPGDAHPGAWAVALGRTYRSDRTNVTVGIISAVNRMFGRAIQTDADVSAANYGGPLVDIRGRVLGLLVPMAPQETSEVAGAEWYDSGIGFAVPLAPLADRIELMKKGQDQRAGMLGVGLKTANPHSAAAELSVVRPDSPAGLAGLKKGDRIIEINGKPIHSQTDMRFALGTAYADDEVRLVAKRGDERLERTIKLVGKMPAFRHPFLGILPMRPPAEVAAKQAADAPAKDDEPAAKEASKEPSAADAGLVVRLVYPGSPAAQAGIAAGDRITQINDTKINSTSDAIQALNNTAPGSKLSVTIIHAGTPTDRTLTAGQLPTSVPSELPPAAQRAADAESKPAPGETVALKLPEFAHTCSVYVPAAQAANQSLAALLWLQTPADTKPDDAIREWQSLCDRDGIVLIVPKPGKADHWEKTDLEYLHRLLERATAEYKIDPQRVVVAGQGAAATIVWPLGLASRDLVHGIASIATPIPRQLKVPENDAARRIAVFAAIPPKKDAAAAISAGLKNVSDAGYNIATITTNTAGQLSATEREELARWIDTLDRF